jgi:hypothetical protein
MGQMEDFLATLSDKQKKAFAAALAEDSPKVEQTPKRRGRPKKNELILPEVEQDVEEEEDFAPKKKRKVVKIRMEDDNDEGEETGQKRRGARPKNRKGGNTGGERFCRSEPLGTGPRKNAFIDMAEFNASKELVKEDKEALKKGRPAARMVRSTLYEVECVRCHREFEVGAGLAHKRFVCDGCITGRG